MDTVSLTPYQQYLRWHCLPRGDLPPPRITEDTKHPLCGNIFMRLNLVRFVEFFFIANVMPYFIVFIVFSPRQNPLNIFFSLVNTSTTDPARVRGWEPDSSPLPLYPAIPTSPSTYVGVSTWWWGTDFYQPVLLSSPPPGGDHRP